MTDIILNSMLVLCSISGIICIFMLYVIQNAKTSLWCCKLYCYIFERKVYDFYTNCMDSGDVIVCDLDTWVERYLSYNGATSSDVCEKWNPKAYYYITDMDSVKFGNEWVITSFFAPMCNEIKLKK